MCHASHSHTQHRSIDGNPAGEMWPRNRSNDRTVIVIVFAVLMAAQHRSDVKNVFLSCENNHFIHTRQKTKHLVRLPLRLLLLRSVLLNNLFGFNRISCGKCAQQRTWPIRLCHNHHSNGRWIWYLLFMPKGGKKQRRTMLTANGRAQHMTKPHCTPHKVPELFPNPISDDHIIGCMRKI